MPDKKHADKVKRQTHTKKASAVKPEASSLKTDSVAEIKKAHQEEISQLNDKLLRMAAELENVRKRSENQASDLRQYAIQNFAKEMINILENFHLIMANAPRDKIAGDEVFEKFFKGIEITQNDLSKVFEQNGIKRIYPLGEKFDHNLHQVVSQAESDKEPGTIIQVVQAGYSLNDRLLKEAMVVISKPK